jgi:hypothetical protein
VYDPLYFVQEYLWMALSFTSAVITVYSVYKMIRIIKELENDYNTPKLIAHALLVVIQTSTVCLYSFANGYIKTFEVVIVTDFVCQMFIAFICLTMGS